MPSAGTRKSDDVRGFSLFRLWDARNRDEWNQSSNSVRRNEPASGDPDERIVVELLWAERSADRQDAILFTSTTKRTRDNPRRDAQRKQRLQRIHKSGGVTQRRRTLGSCRLRADHDGAQFIEVKGFFQQIVAAFREHRVAQ